jgi:hypothetical protein
MKLLQWILTGICSLYLFTSCSKDKEQVIETAVVSPGVYEGKYGTGNNTPSTFYSFRLNGDGTMQEIDVSGNVVGTGAWTINGTTFRASYHYIFPATAYFVATGTYDQATKKISGTWGYDDNDKDGGKWNMIKK